jgi:hypothetical protein
MRHELRTDIDIAAPPEAVWAHLVDFPAYRDWNPFIPSAAGTAEAGRRLNLRMRPPGGRAVPIRPRVTEVRPNGVLEWLGHLGVPGLFDGRHSFELTGLPDGGTRLVQSETFTGILVPLMGSTLDRTRAGFALMNEALRERAGTAASGQTAATSGERLGA